MSPSFQYFISSVFLLTASLSAANPTVRIGVGDYPPTINRQLESPSEIVINSINSMKQGRIDAVYVHYGQRWDQVYQDLIDGSIDASLWWADSPQRREMFHYPNKALISFANSMTGLKNNARIAGIPDMPSTDDLKGLKIGQIENFYVPEMIDPKQVVFVANAEELAKGLSNGQFDLVLRKTEPMQTLFDELNIQSKLKKINIKRIEGYLILSKALAPEKAQAIIQANDAHIETLMIP